MSVQIRPPASECCGVGWGVILLLVKDYTGSSPVPASEWRFAMTEEMDALNREGAQ